jgi:hypothetical protein
MIPSAPICPAKLQPGDLVALVAPCGWVRPERAEVAAQVLTAWGLRVRLGGNALRRHFYLAGTDEERLADFNSAFRDPLVRGSCVYEADTGRCSRSLRSNSVHSACRFSAACHSATAISRPRWATECWPYLTLTREH